MWQVQVRGTFPDDDDMNGGPSFEDWTTLEPVMVKAHADALIDDLIALGYEAQLMEVS